MKQPCTETYAVRKTPRVLFIAEAVTLAHVGRAFALASILHASRDFCVTFACDPRYSPLLPSGIPYRTITSIPTNRFLTALSSGRRLYSVPDLRGYVAEDVSLLQSLRPDIVVGDFRLSLSVSARITNVPYVNVTNAYWSPFARPELRMPALPVSRFFPGFVGDTIFRAVSPWAFSMHARSLNTVRSEYGLDRFSDIRYAYCDGDCTLYADVPELIPTFDLPENHRYIGAPIWEPAVERPAWLHQTLGEPFIYVSLGTSGRAALLPSVVEALAAFALPIVVAVGHSNHAIPDGPKLLAAPFLPGHEIASKATILICNGGSPSAQQALYSGVPVLGIASNLDQFLNMSYIERFGAGTLLRADRASVERIRTTVARLLEAPQQRFRAAQLSLAYRRIDPRIEFPRAIGQYHAGSDSSKEG